jgi:hypothetical protein
MSIFSGAFLGAVAPKMPNKEIIHNLSKIQVT